MQDYYNFLKSNRFGLVKDLIKKTSKKFYNFLYKHGIIWVDLGEIEYFVILDKLKRNKYLILNFISE